MDSLSFQDAAFLRLESPERPFHVGGLMVFAPPANAPATYLRDLVARLACELPRSDALFRRKLAPGHAAAPRWIEAGDLDSRAHLLHYALPQPGRMQDLLRLVSRAHERLLERDRPLWEWHLIEGLPRGRFALYCKIHHALIDGVGALRLANTLLSDDPRAPFGAGAAPAGAPADAGRRSKGWLGGLSRQAVALLAQGRAVPELATLLFGMRGDGGPPLPFSAPHAIMNTDINRSRCIVTTSFALGTLRRIGRAADATVNDVLLAICGGALRAYLAGQNKLPPRSLLAGVPVSVKTPGSSHGNHLSTIVCPLGTTTRDPLVRLRNISRVTRRAKQDLRGLSQAAREDYMNLILLPTLVLTLAHAATAIPPAFNVIVSNVPGPQGPRFLAGARLEELYPLSVVTDAQALNITALGCGSRLCLGVTSCPEHLPGIEAFAAHLTNARRELQRALGT